MSLSRNNDPRIKLLVPLLRSGLGGDIALSLPPEANWDSVISLAMSQGLDALAFDGLLAIYERHPELGAALDASLGEKKIEWLGYTLQAERDYEAYREKLRDLAAFFGKEGLRMLVLKGYGLSLDYPNPAHRPTGDLDVYFYGRGKEADERMKTGLGIEPKQNEDKHSKSRYKGLLVENHATFLNVAGHPGLREIEDELEHEALEATTCTIAGIGFLVPSPAMNALFLPCHMATHFAYDGITMKQWVDWAAFAIRHGRELDWEPVRGLAERAGRLPLFRAFNGIVQEHFGVPSSCLPDWGRDTNLEDKIWIDCLTPRKDRSSRSVGEKLHDYFSSRWKYRLAYPDSYFLNFFRQGWASFRGRHLPRSRPVWNRILH